MIRSLSRHGYTITIAVLLLAILGIAGYLLAVAVPDLAGRAAGTEAPSPAPSATPRSAMALSPIAIEMPPDADCGACHVTASGNVGTKPIPKLGHPLLGFRNCTACHKPDGLVQTAAGHSGLHKDDCLVCHQVPTTTSGTIAPLRPEHMGIDQPCTACHGVDEHAPLPADMQGRDSCWICHNGPEFQYLFETPTPAASAAPSASPATLGLLPGS